MTRATNTGAIDPLHAIGEVAREYGVWSHADGAYGLPGILDQRVAPLHRGLNLADSVIVDPHKWLGAAVGVAATFVRGARCEMWHAQDLTTTCCAWGTPWCTKHRSQSRSPDLWAVGALAVE